MKTIHDLGRLSDFKGTSSDPLIVPYRQRNICKGKLTLENGWVEKDFGGTHMLPRLRPYPRASNRPWRFNLFWKENREQFFLFGTVVFLLLVLGRYFYP